MLTPENVALDSDVAQNKRSPAELVSLPAFVPFSSPAAAASEESCLFCRLSDHAVHQTSWLQSATQQTHWFLRLPSGKTHGLFASRAKPIRVPWYTVYQYIYIYILHYYSNQHSSQSGACNFPILVDVVAVNFNQFPSSFWLAKLQTFQGLLLSFKTQFIDFFRVSKPQAISRPVSKPGNTTLASAKKCTTHTTTVQECSISSQYELLYN